jgi:hypothetical protein
MGRAGFEPATDGYESAAAAHSRAKPGRNATTMRAHHLTAVRAAANEQPSAWGYVGRPPCPVRSPRPGDRPILALRPRSPITGMLLDRSGVQLESGPPRELGGDRCVPMLVFSAFAGDFTVSPNLARRPGQDSNLRPAAQKAVPTQTTAKDGRHESPANATFLRPRRRALRIAERSAARTFGPLLGHSGPRELGGLDAASPGAKWRRNVATTSCQARRYWSSSLIPGRSDAQCQAGPARRGRGQRGPRRSAWTTRKSTSQRPTPARFHSRCQRPSRADAGSHRRPGKAPGCDAGDSSVSRKAQLEAGVLARMDGGSDGIVPASRRGCRE